MFRFGAVNSAPCIDLVSRRGFLRAGGATVGGLTLADLLRGQAQADSNTRPKSAILIFPPRIGDITPDGRGHWPEAGFLWMAGGGMRGGSTYGASDDIGFRAAENRVHINDLHATILHLLGLDHELLTYSYNGRDFRLTDVAGRVIRDVIA